MKANKQKNPVSPLLSVDVVPFFVNKEGKVHIVLSKRPYEPYLGEYALPGVLVVAGETLQEAINRALKLKSGIKNNQIGHIMRTGVYDSPYRDSRGPTISIAYAVELKEISEEELTSSYNKMISLPIEKNLNLPFDHMSIIIEAIEMLSGQLLEDNGKWLCAFLGDTFTTPQFVNLQKSINPTFNTTNAHRMLSSQKFLMRTGETLFSPGRAPRSWRRKNIEVNEQELL